MSRGITLHEDEARELSRLLADRFEDMPAEDRRQLELDFEVSNEY